MAQEATQVLTVSQIAGLFELPSPILTAYIRTNPVDESLHGSTSRYFHWLQQTGEDIAFRLPDAERKIFLKQLGLVLGFLTDHISHERGLVIFAGPSVWQVIFLKIEVANELHWGEPEVNQLVLLTAEHQPCGILAVDHAEVKFFDYWLGELSEDQERRFVVDTSQWKKKDMERMGPKRVKMARGPQKDLFQRRLESHYEDLCHQAAKRAVEFCAKNPLAAIFLVGPDRLVNAIERAFPAGFQPKVIKFHQDLAGFDQAHLLKHLGPKIEEWEEAHQQELVSSVIERSLGMVAEFDEVLSLLQKGKLGMLVLARGLDVPVHKCIQCGWLDRSADPICSICGGALRTVKANDVIPEMALRQDVHVFVVRGVAAMRLKEKGGMAGRLRKTQRATAVAAT